MAHPVNYKTRKHKRKRWESYYEVILSGFFVGVIVSSFYALHTLISIYSISKVFALFAFAGLLIPQRFYKKWFNFNLFEMFFLNILCVGPMLTAIFLVLNFYFTSATYDETYHIDAARTYINNQLGSNDVDEIVFYFQKDKLKDYPRMRTFRDNDLRLAIKATEVKYTLAKGLFGFTVEKEHQFLRQ